MFLLYDGKHVNEVTELGQDAFPFAINTTNDNVVFVKWTKEGIEAQGLPSGPYKAYTESVSMERRRRCQSVLGDLALHRRSFTSPALQEVTRGVLEYIEFCQKNEKDIVGSIKEPMTRSLFPKVPRFGRLGEPKDMPSTDDELLPLLKKTLAQGSLPSILAIHDFMANKVFKTLRGTTVQDAFYSAAGNLVRPAYLFGPEESRLSEKAKDHLRGRKERVSPKPTTTPGIMPEGSKLEGVEPYQKRERGIDKWEQVQRGVDGWEAIDGIQVMKTAQFNIDVKSRNLVYGAGPSGSTGPLLQAAFLFGDLDEELLKQYVLAIVGYLVGGGMHTYHEVMTVAKLVGCPYKEAAYEPSLPQSFLNALEGKSWRTKYYDIVVLGQKLWLSLWTEMPKVGRLSQQRVAELQQRLVPSAAKKQ